MFPYEKMVNITIPIISLFLVLSISFFPTSFSILISLFRFPPICIYKKKKLSRIYLLIFIFFLDYWIMDIAFRAADIIQGKFSWISKITLFEKKKRNSDSHNVFHLYSRKYIFGMIVLFPNRCTWKIE